MIRMTPRPCLSGEKLQKEARFIMYNRRCCNEWLNYIVKLIVVSRHIQVHLRPLPYTLSGPRQPQPNRFTPAILSLMCCLVLSNNLQTFEVINYTITLPLRGHGSIISQILMGLCAPRLNSIKCLVSLQYEQYIVRHLGAYLVWCVLWW